MPAAKTPNEPVPSRKLPPSVCGECSSTEILVVEIELPAGKVEFRTCSNCERRWWERQGDPVPLTEVLNLVSETRR